MNETRWKETKRKTSRRTVFTTWKVQNADEHEWEKHAKNVPYICVAGVISDGWSLSLWMCLLIKGAKMKRKKKEEKDVHVF